jgi:hypothetical protein
VKLRQSLRGSRQREEPRRFPKHSFASEWRPSNSYVGWMRTFLVLGFLSVVGCGLELGGAGISLPDAEALADDASTSQEGAIRGDGGTEIPVSPDGIGADGTPSNSLDGQPDSAAPVSDGATDASRSDGPRPSEASTTPCLNALPTGWSLVLYDLGSDACPSDFVTHDVAGQAAIQPGACSCDCTVAQPGNCAQGTLSVHPSAGGNGACDLDGGWSKDLDGSECTVLGFSKIVAGPHSDQSTPLVAQGGTCDDITLPDMTQISAAAARYCDVPWSSADSVCNGMVSSGFAACIMASGETTCPAGSPFVHSYVVEDSLALQCSSCAGCTVATSCSNATLTGFSDTACSSQNVIASVGIDGSCNPVNLVSSPSALVAIEYAVTATSDCTAGTSTPSAQLTNPRTICCR